MRGRFNNRNAGQTDRTTVQQPAPPRVRTGAGLSFPLFGVAGSFSTRITRIRANS
jgi:hypothetical protein